MAWANSFARVSPDHDTGKREVAHATRFRTAPAGNPTTKWRGLARRCIR